MYYVCVLGEIIWKANELQQYDIIMLLITLIIRNIRYNALTCKTSRSTLLSRKPLSRKPLIDAISDKKA